MHDQDFISQAYYEEQRKKMTKFEKFLDWFLDIPFALVLLAIFTSVVMFIFKKLPSWL